MTEPTVPSPNEDEIRNLRKDAQEGVSGARAALGGDSDALKEWRATQNK